MISLKRKGVLFLLSSPSGTGKTSIIREILKKDKELRLSVSVTTRPRREDEVHEKDYVFLSLDEFQELILKNSFIEYAKVFGNYYGTLKEPIMERIQRGQDVILDVDWQGARKLSSYFSNDLVKIFVLPPSLEVLNQRLIKRNLDNDQTIKNRMKDVVPHVSQWNDYDYVIVNDNLNKTIENVFSIIQGERLKKNRQIWVEDFIQNIYEDSKANV